MYKLLFAVGLSVGRLSKTTTLSDPRSLKILVLSEISCVTSLDLKLLPCIPCFQNASTLSCRQTMDSIWKSKVSSDDNFLLDFNLPWRLTIFIQPREKQKSLTSKRRAIFSADTHKQRLTIQAHKDGVSLQLGHMSDACLRGI